jgi:protein arginine kinase activator
MNCDNCHKYEASVHYQQVINGKASELHLCEKCASEKGMISLSTQNAGHFGNLLSGFLGEDEILGKGKKVKLKCKCGWTNIDLKKTGYLGCPLCYKTFNRALTPLLRRIHGSNKHIGKIPTKITFTEPVIAEKEAAEPLGAPGNIDEFLRLKRELDAAVKEERYEEAANLRDRIKMLELEKSVDE